MKLSTDYSNPGEEIQRNVRVMGLQWIQAEVYSVWEI